MPLPPSLLAKLQKRGLVRQDAPEQVEEVIAESYDEHDHEEEPIDTEPEPEFSVKVVYTVSDCPNTANRYHECTDWCQEHFGVKSFHHTEEDERKRIRMLNKYPLPPGWIEVGDPTSSRCYYWNTDSDKVSWLPPQHPRAKITVSAEKLQSSLKTSSKLPSVNGPGGMGEKRKPVSVSIKEPRSESSKKRRTDRREKDELDPMDPASYSEVERGTWSTGLKADVKTGVDSTASGPLFQQRPYPSPGDILRAQAAAQQNEPDEG